MTSGYYSFLSHREGFWGPEQSPTKRETTFIFDTTSLPCNRFVRLLTTSFVPTQFTHLTYYVHLNWKKEEIDCKNARSGRFQNKLKKIARFCLLTTNSSGLHTHRHPHTHTHIYIYIYIYIYKRLLLRHASAFGIDHLQRHYSTKGSKRNYFMLTSISY